MLTLTIIRGSVSVGTAGNGVLASIYSRNFVADFFGSFTLRQELRRPLH